MLKTGLVMEGGAMRGLFTAGVMDVFMEKGIRFDGAVGVSAGATFGCNYKSRQIGRVIRYNKRFCRDWRFGSIRSFLKTGDIYNADFCYRDLPGELDIFDTKTYAENPMEFYYVCTDAESGEAVYYKSSDGGEKDLQWMRASASIPILSRMVPIEGGFYCDGGCIDPIPLKYFESIGYQRNVVLLTQPQGFRQEPSRMEGLIEFLLRKYPELVRTLKGRAERYNQELDYVADREMKGEALVIRPPESLRIGKMEDDPRELERVYQIGRRTAERRMEEVQTFLGTA